MPKKQSLQKKKELKVKFLPFDVSVDVPAGTKLLDAVKKADLPLKATCGGKGTCGGCVVQILNGNYRTKASAALSNQLASEGYALSCQTGVTDNITVQLPQFREQDIKSVVDSKFFKEERENISGTHELRPAVRKIDLQLPPPTQDDNYSDLKRIERELKKTFPGKKISCEYSVLKKLAHVVRKDRGKISVILILSENQATLIDAVPKSAKKEIYGVACDIGTTTVALHLVNLEMPENQIGS
jgi:uncharacterized 2Fe-2S/4Fe-4S cluster protein (DUF4445 family)